MSSKKVYYWVLEWNINGMIKIKSIKNYRAKEKKNTSTRLYFSDFKYKKENKKVHLYGASTKMNVVLEAAGIDSNLIEYAAERSKEKWGAETLSGIKIISEEQSKQMKPDAYICSLIGFKEEILLREKQYLESGGSFIFLPSMEIF